MTDLPPEYHQFTEEEYGDAVSVSEDFLKKHGKSLTYLKLTTDDLKDLTDPELRKRFTPPLLDSALSYGVVLDEGQNEYKFSDAISDGFSESFANMNNIEEQLTNAWIDMSGNGEAKIPLTISVAEAIDAKSVATLDATINTYYYVGYRKGKPFWLSPAWVNNPFNSNFPSVLRAQSFKAGKTGKLSKVFVKLHGNPNAEDKVYCEIRTVNPTTGAPTTTVLAREEILVKKHTKSDWYAIAFKNKPPVVTGTKYAIVIRSPFTSNKNHIGVGGWTKFCHGDKYADGSAFTSLDNGLHWVQHGYDDLNVPYKEGRIRPRDYAFVTYIETTGTTYPINTDYFVYFKPLRTNPMTRVVLSVTDSVPANTSIVYEVSTDFKNWTAVNGGNNWTVNLSEPYSTHLWVRAKLRTTVNSATPSIQDINVHVDTLPASSAYARTQFYNPRTGTILGASIWSRINAPLVLEPNTEGTIEIIRNIEISDYFTGDGVTTEFTLSEAPAEPLLYVIIGNDDERVEYRDYEVTYTDGVPKIKFDTAPVDGAGFQNIRVEYNPLWIRDLSPSDFPLKTDLFTETFVFDGNTDTVSLKVAACDPLRVVTLDGVGLVEDVDFTVDYLTKEVVLTAGNPESGSELIVKYTPFLVDEGLAIAYRISRSNLVNQARIQPNYFQTRT